MIKPTENLRLRNYGFTVGQHAFGSFYKMLVLLKLLNGDLAWESFRELHNKLSHMKSLLERTDQLIDQALLAKNEFEKEFGCYPERTKRGYCGTDLSKKF